MSDGQPDSIPWWKDKAILAALTPIVAVILKIVQINFGGQIAKFTGLAVNTWTAEDVLTYAGGLAALLSGAYLVRRRVRHGKDPANPSPLITGGAIAQKVIGAEPKPAVDEFGQIAEQVDPRPEILNVVSDPESPRLAPPLPGAVRAGLTQEELFALMRARDQLQAARAQVSGPTGEGQAPVA